MGTLTCPQVVPPCAACQLSVAPTAALLLLLS